MPPEGSQGDICIKRGRGWHLFACRKMWSTQDGKISGQLLRPFLQGAGVCRKDTQDNSLLCLLRSHFAYGTAQWQITSACFIGLYTLKHTNYFFYCGAQYPQLCWILTDIIFFWTCGTTSDVKKWLKFKFREMKRYLEGFRKEIHVGF